MPIDGGDGNGGDGDPPDDGDGTNGDEAGDDSSGCTVQRDDGGFGDLLCAAGIALLAAIRRRGRYSPRSSPLQ